MFDGGREVAGKAIAVNLRVLLHDNRHSRSLLDQLGLRNGRYFDTAGPLNPGNLVAECNLTVLRVTSTGARHVAAVACGGGPYKAKLLPFAEWWNNPQLRDPQRRTFSRRELILHVADTDGGAHVDPGLDPAYMDMSRNRSFGWNFFDGQVERPADGRIELICMRQIAHEAFLSLSRNAAGLGDVVKPVIPEGAG